MRRSILRADLSDAFRNDDVDRYSDLGNDLFDDDWDFDALYEEVIVQYDKVWVTNPTQ